MGILLGLTRPHHPVRSKQNNVDKSDDRMKQNSLSGHKKRKITV